MGFLGRRKVAMYWVEIIRSPEQFLFSDSFNIYKPFESLSRVQDCLSVLVGHVRTKAVGLNSYGSQAFCFVELFPPIDRMHYFHIGFQGILRMYYHAQMRTIGRSQRQREIFAQQSALCATFSRPRKCVYFVETVVLAEHSWACDRWLTG
jgi:hypothetical protein